MSSDNKYFENSGNRLRRPFITNWTTGDVVALMITMTIALILLLTSSPTIALVVGVPLMASTIRVEWGRLYSDIGALLLKDPYIRLALRDKLYQADDGQYRLGLRIVRFLREKRYLPASCRHVMPVNVGVIEVPSTDGTVMQLGVLWDPGCTMVHLMIRGSGSDFASHDQPRQHDLSCALAASIDGVVAGAEEGMGISYVRLTRPVNNYAIAKYLIANGQPLYFVPEQFNLDDDAVAMAERMQTAYDEIVMTQRERGVADVWQLVVVSVKWTKEVERAIQGKLDDRQVRNLPIVQLAERMVEAIDAAGMGVRDVHVLDADELREVVRASWDVADLDFHEPQLDEDGSIRPFSIYPQREVAVGHDRLCMDGSWISTVRIAGKPQRFDITQMQRLFHGSAPLGMWSSMASVGEPLSGAAETRTLMVRTAFAINLRGAFASGRVVEHPNIARRQKEVEDRMWEMSGVSLGRQYNEYFCIVATSEEEMERDRKRVLADLRAAGCKAAVVTGRSRQVAAYLTATLGINQL